MDPEDIDALLAGAEPRLRRAWLALLHAAREARTLEQLAELLAAGRIDEAMTVFERSMSSLTRVWQEEYVQAGSKAAELLGEALSDAGRGEVVVVFDMLNDGAVRAMQENSLRLVREFSDQQRRATREALLDGISRGANPRDQARAFRDSIGLTQKQQQAVNNYRRLLETRDRQALERQLRDRRFDRTVRGAIDNNTPLSQAQIDRMVERYRQRAVAHRAETIARTESLRSVHQGSRQMFEQAVESGTLTSNELVREWNTAGDERVRSFNDGPTSHRTMHGQIRRGMDEPFISGAGNPLLYPADPSAPGYDTIQCRCRVGTRLDIAAGAVQGIEIIEEA